MANQITTKLDLDSSGFVSQIKKVKADIQAAETATGKMKAGAKGLGDTLKNNAGPAALAAAGALAAFAAKGVKAFQDTALESGKFADATGTSVEEASRLREVAGDLGIEFGTVQSAMQRFNKAAADGSVDVEGFGNVVVKAADGTTDAYQSFINAATAIGSIEDPAKRAEAAQKTFGKSYGEIAELMEMDAKDLKAALDGVSDAKVIDDEELRKAKAFRDAMDRLNGVVEDLQLAVGEMVVENADLLDSFAANLEMVVKYSGEIATLGRGLAAVVSPTMAVREALNLTSDEISFTSTTLEELQSWLESHGASAEETAAAIDKWKAAQQAAAKEAVGLAEDVESVDRSAQDFTDEVNRAERATRDLENAYKSLSDELSGTEAWIGVENAIDDYREKINEAGASNRDKRLALVQLKQELISYLSSLEGVPAEKQTEILALIDQGAFDEAELALSYLARGRQVAISPTTGGQLPNVSSGINGRRAMGGPVSAGGAYLVGENGPEVLQMGAASGNVVPNHKLGGGGNTYVINTASDPNAVIAAIKQYERMNGKGWRS